MEPRARSVADTDDDPAAALLKGALDIHVHACPHIGRRRVDAIEAAQQAHDAGLDAIVLIDNFAPSSGVAGLVEGHLQRTRPFSVLGGIVLNHPVGLINPHAVETAIRYGNGAAFVSLPTHHTRHSVLTEGRGAAEAARAFAVRERIEGDLAAVLDLVATNDLVLNTGHVSAPEAIRLAEEARARGIGRLLVPAVGFDHASLARLADLGAMLEFTAFFLSHAAELPLTHIDATATTTPRHAPVELAAAIRAVGPQHCVVASDAGSWILPPPVEALRGMLATLLTLGLGEEAVALMVRTNPRRLFDRFLDA